MTPDGPAPGGGKDRCRFAFFLAASGSAASALAFTALQAVQQALPEYRRSALGQLRRTEEAEAEARRAYATEQNRRWFRANPTGADAVAAATKAADAARERTAQYLLTVRLEQLRERPRPAPRRPGPRPSGGWSGCPSSLPAPSMATLAGR